MTTQEQVLQAVRDERARQDAKWGVQRHDPATWLTILMEEIGEAARNALEGDPVGYAEELVQVAAVAVAALEDCYAPKPPPVNRNDWLKPPEPREQFDSEPEVSLGPEF